MKSLECPVCFSSKISLDNVFDFKSKKVRVLKCDNCSLVFLKNKVSADYGKEYYDRGRKGIFKKIEELYIKKSNFYKKMLIDANVDKKKNVRILDVGSGEGLFLNMLGEDYNKEGVEVGRVGDKDIPKNIKMHYSRIEKIKLKKDYYEVITLWHVLEHLDNPRISMKVIHRLLNRKGILVLSTPNTNSYGYKLAGRNWYHFDYPYHKYLYNKKSLRVLTDNCGFKIKRFIRYPFEFPLDLFWSILRSKKSLLLILIYPMIKLFDEETIMCIVQKK